MRNKMNLDVIAETNEEKNIEQYINMLHKSKEVKIFLEEMQAESKKRNVYKFRSRIKDVNSAIRTHRINKKGLDDVRDYVGISFITNTEEEIYPIIDYLKEKLPNGDFVDFVAEENIYSPLVYIKWVPPLGYNILAKEPMIPNQKSVPIEVRVCSKEAYISEQSAYYSIQKNDKTGLPIEEKQHLRDLAQHISYKLALLNIRQLSINERERHTIELNNIIDNNFDFINSHKELVIDAILDMGRLIYKCEHDDEISVAEKVLSQKDIDDIDDKIKLIFSNNLDVIKIFDKNITNNVFNAIKEMRNIDYRDIKNEVLNN
ncbi:MAG: hypothetical protein ACI4VE_03795 [Clostridia bacterium]